MGFYYFDYTYFVFILPALIVSIWAQARVKSTFSKYSQIRTGCSLTGQQAAQRVLDWGGAYNVGFQRIGGSLTDNYNPSTNIISLSEPVWGSTSIASIGVAAHEAGHAVQYATGYGPIKLRSAIVPVVRIGSGLSMPLIIIGLILPVQYDFVVNLGILLFSLSVVFSLVTLPVEFNASNRAIRALAETGILTNEELAGAKKVLGAAAMTYVASTFTAIMSLLRLLTIVNNRRGRN